MLLQTLPFFGNPWCKHTILISRFMKGIFHLKPPLPKYVCTWDVSLVLKFLKGLYPLDNICLKMLTLKLTALIALCCAPRAQALQSLSIKFMKVQKNDIIFAFPNLLKTSRIGKRHVLCIEHFKEEELCPMHTLLFYLRKTKKFRKTYKVLISYKTFQSVSTSTIARWLKTVLTYSGINTCVFKAHSFRAATTSAAFDRGCSLDHILKTADWKNDKNFYKFYYRSCNSVNRNLNFTSAVLSVS